MYTDYINRIFDQVTDKLDALEKASGYTLEELIQMFSAGYKLYSPKLTDVRCSSCKHFHYEGSLGPEEDILTCGKGHNNHIDWAQCPCYDFERREDFNEI